MQEFEKLMVLMSLIDEIVDKLSAIKDTDMFIATLGVIVDGWQDKTQNDWDKVHDGLERLCEAHANIHEMFS